MMRPRRLLIALAVLGTLVLPVAARMIAPAPIAERVAQANRVILGTVTSIEEKGVSHEGTEYKLAIVKVNEAIEGGKDQTHLRVAFLPRVRVPSSNLQKNIDVLLFLTPVKGETFYTARMYYDTVNKTSPNWAKEVEITKTCARALESADRWITDGKPEERALAAGMLILKYRPVRIATKPGDAVAAAQSKAILLALADSDWSKQDAAGPLGLMTGRNLFNRLNLTPADGWNPPANVQLFDAAAKKWLKDHAGTYRIQRLVPTDK